MSSEYRSRSVRGHVGQLDPTSAADYNLSLKLGNATPRGGSLAPWLGGGERLPDPPAAPFTDASNRVADGVPPGSLPMPPPSASLHGAPSSGLSGLSHQEKLQRMRELRQSAAYEQRMAEMALVPQ